jgi:hypothetical protein
VSKIHWNYGKVQVLEILSLRRLFEPFSGETVELKTVVWFSF